MLYSITNYEEFNNLYFHDNELDSILLVYKSKEAKVKLLKITKGHQEDIHLVFNEVTDIHIPLVEPWGSGFYVSSVEVKPGSF